MLHSTAGCMSVVCILACIQFWHSLGCLGTTGLGWMGASWERSLVPLHCSLWMLSCLMILVAAAVSLGLFSGLGFKCTHGDSVLVPGKGMLHQR